jgi:hypothetical protein
VKLKVLADGSAAPATGPVAKAISVDEPSRPADASPAQPLRRTLVEILRAPQADGGVNKKSPLGHPRAELAQH